MDGSNRFLDALDQIEKRVELMRTQAVYLEHEKSSLLETLHLLQGSDEFQTMNEVDKEDIEANAERLIIRCLTVDISITTPRNQAQEKALADTQAFLQEIQTKINSDLEKSKALIKSLLNACNVEENYDGPVNQKFQMLVIGCTAEDQKEVKQGLEQWLRALNTATDCA